MKSAGETLASMASPSPEVRRTVDWDGRRRELLRQAEQIKAKYGVLPSAKNLGAALAEGSENPLPTTAATR